MIFAAYTIRRHRTRHGITRRRHVSIWLKTKKQSEYKWKVFFVSGHGGMCFSDYHNPIVTPAAITNLIRAHARRKLRQTTKSFCHISNRTATVTTVLLKTTAVSMNRKVIKTMISKKNFDWQKFAFVCKNPFDMKRYTILKTFDYLWGSYNITKIKYGNQYFCHKKQFASWAFFVNKIIIWCLIMLSTRLSRCAQK